MRADKEGGKAGEQKNAQFITFLSQILQGREGFVIRANSFQPTKIKINRANIEFQILCHHATSYVKRHLFEFSPFMLLDA